MSLLVATVSLIGERAGGWDLIGEIGIGAGTGATLLLTAIGILANAPTKQVDTVHAAVQTNGSTLHWMDGTLDSMDTKLDTLDDLDIIQTELDAQTDALDHQVSILAQIRDRF